jgi:L-rhamnose mutarotase
MNRYVLTIDLRDGPGVVEEYRRQHARVWPEVLASLTAAGVREMEIYLLGRRLVMSLELEEGLDAAAVFERHASSGPRVAEWERLMSSLQQPAPGAGSGRWWAVMEPVFRLSAQVRGRAPGDPPQAG